MLEISNTSNVAGSFAPIANDRANEVESTTPTGRKAAPALWPSADAERRCIANSQMHATAANASDAPKEARDAPKGTPPSIHEPHAEKTGRMSAPRQWGTRQICANAATAHQQHTADRAATTCRSGEAHWTIPSTYTRALDSIAA